MALFAQDDIALTDTLKLTLGGRYDSHEIFGENFSPKAYVVYQLADGITLKGGVSEAFKAPDGSYLSPEYSVISCGGACYLSGNPDLKAETSVNYEAGIEISQALSDLSVAWFHNDIDDLIDREITYDDTTGSATAAEWVNVAKATTKGLEASGSVDVAAALRLSANYTRLITEADDGSGNKSELTGRPQHQANMSALWQASEALAATVSVNYTAGMYAEAWVNNGGWTLLQGRMPSYFRTDAGLSAQVTPALTVRGGVKNLGNVRPDEMSALFTTYELGRSYYLSGTYNF
jgi:outer membrane receptor for ferrienterochelin and colicins